MKKSVLVLLLLLVVLIVTCVYDKTYTIYSTSSAKEIILVERKNVSKQENTTQTVGEWRKEIKSTALPVATAPTSTKPVEVKPEPEVAHKPVVKTEKTVEKEAKEETVPSTKPVEVKPEPEVAHKPVVKTEKTIEKEAKKKTVPSTKNSIPAAKVPAILTKEASAPKPVTTDKTKPVTQNAEEKEIVDYLMWALKNRDIALKNRDEVEARIQELITKALNDRKVVLEERSKNEIALEKLQTEQINARDASYESVINPKTTNQGEK